MTGGNEEQEDSYQTRNKSICVLKTLLAITYKLQSNREDFLKLKIGFRCFAVRRVKEKKGYFRKSCNITRSEYGDLAS